MFIADDTGPFEFLAGKSRLAGLLFNDGLIYFFIAFLSNFLATIFIQPNLNPVMSIIVNDLSPSPRQIAAYRIVRHLADYSTNAWLVV
ncbi:hypothetical protein DFH09DRAFT_1309181 [Mycena vulgaris]|nr:hypothetical protein DFH09DRAFT_1309181 [Mycena vulgaris]